MVFIMHDFYTEVTPREIQTFIWKATWMQHFKTNCGLHIFLQDDWSVEVQSLGLLTDFLKLSECQFEQILRLSILLGLGN